MEELSKEFGLLVGSVIIAITGYMVSEFKAWLVVRRTNKKENFVYQAQKDKYLDDILVEVRHETDADSASIYQLHNGTQYKGGDPIKYYSMSHEKPHNYAKSWKEESQRLLLYGINETFLELVNDKIVHIKKDEAKDWMLNKTISIREYDSVIMVYLQGEKGTPLGFLKLCYFDYRPSLTDEQRAQLGTYSKNISFKLKEY